MTVSAGRLRYQGSPDAPGAKPMLGERKSQIGKVGGQGYRATASRILSAKERIGSRGRWDVLLDCPERPDTVLLGALAPC